MNTFIKIFTVALTSAIALSSTSALMAQQGFGTNTPAKSAVVDMTATSKGFLAPRVALTSSIDVTTVPTPANALTVFNTATAGTTPNEVTPGYYFYSIPNAVWVRVANYSDLDLRAVGVNNHITKDAGVGSNGTAGGNQNVIAIGAEAGNSNTGASNMFIGTRSGFKNGLFSFNTFLGHYAGENNLGGFGTFVGYASGRANTTGSQNTFIGDESGLLNVSGSLNTFLGKASGQNNVSGSNNSYVGLNAGLKGINGNDNTMIGFQAGLNNDNSNNTFVGSLSGINNTDGNSNVFIGANSGESTTEGGSNTFLGSFSGNANMSGTDNVYIGFTTGLTSTGSRNIIIGATSYAPVKGGSDQLNIGNLIFGTNVDGRKTTKSTGNIGIGTSTPTVKLEVAGDFKVSGLAGAGSRNVIADNTGKLIIGTAAPGAVFQNIRKTTLNAETIATDDYTVISRATGASTFSLPDPTTNKGRILIIVNHSDNTITFTRNIYRDHVYGTPGSIAGNGYVTTLEKGQNFIGSVTLPNRMTIQSSGDEWTLIGI